MKTRSRAPDMDVEIPDERTFRIISEAHVGSAQRILVVKGFFREVEIQSPDGFELLLLLHLLEGLDARLDEPSEPGLGPEACYEEIHFLHFPGIVEPRLLVNVLFLGDLFVIFSRVSGDLPGSFPVKPHDVSHDAIHETPVVSDEQDFSRPAGQKPFQPADGGDVKVVVRLVEQQQLVVGQKDLGQIETDLESPGKLRRGFFEISPVETETGQDLFDPPEFRGGGLGMKTMRCLIENGFFVKIQMLFYVSHPVILGNRKASGIGLLEPSDDPQERRFAVAVPADQADTLAPVDFEADVFEQGLLPEAFRQIVDGYHLIQSLKTPIIAK